MPRLTLLYRLTICSASRNAHPDFGVGSPSVVQNPLSLNLLTSLGSGAFITVSHPVVRRLNVFPVPLVVCFTLAVPPFPILSVVPKKNASSVLALVMWVFSSLNVRLRRSHRNIFIRCLISSAKAWLPLMPTHQSSAYRRYLILMYSGSLTCLEGEVLMS